MHELGIVFHVIKTIEQVGQEQGLQNVASVTLEGHQHTDSAADDTFTLTYQP